MVSEGMGLCEGFPLTSPSPHSCPSPQAALAAELQDVALWDTRTPFLPPAWSALVPHIAKWGVLLSARGVP